MTGDLSLQAAVIGGLAALLGAVVGAVTTGWAERSRRRHEIDMAAARRLDQWRAQKRTVYAELLGAMNEYRSARSRYEQAPEAGLRRAEEIPLRAAQDAYVMRLGAAAVVTQGTALRKDLVAAAVNTDSLQWSAEFLQRLVDEVDQSQLHNG